jgi:hypothetical protein
MKWPTARALPGADQESHSTHTRLPPQPVITIPQSVRILIGPTPIDMRKSIDGLPAIVLQAWRSRSTRRRSRRRSTASTSAGSPAGLVTDRVPARPGRASQRR